MARKAIKAADVTMPKGALRTYRRLLGYLLDICAEAEARPLKGNSFGVARF